MDAKGDWYQPVLIDSTITGSTPVKVNIKYYLYFYYIETNRILKSLNTLFCFVSMLECLVNLDCEKNVSIKVLLVLTDRSFMIINL